MPLIAAFALGCTFAQLAWSLAAGESAFGAPTFRFLMLAAIEISVSLVVFGGALFLASKSDKLPLGAKSLGVAFFSGVLTLTVAGAPYSLVPRLAQGEAQLAILVGASGVVSAFLGALVGAAFRPR